MNTAQTMSTRVMDQINKDKPSTVPDSDQIFLLKDELNPGYGLCLSLLEGDPISDEEAQAHLEQGIADELNLNGFVIIYYCPENGIFQIEILPDHDYEEIMDYIADAETEIIDGLKIHWVKD